VHVRYRQQTNNRRQADLRRHVPERSDNKSNKKLITRWEYPNVTWRISSYLFTYLGLSTDIHWTRTSPIRHKIDHTQVNLIQLRHLNLNLTSQNIYGTMMCGLRIFAESPIYHLPGNVISATVGLVYINVQPEYELSSSTLFEQFQKFGKIWVGTLSSPDSTGIIFY